MIEWWTSLCDAKTGACTKFPDFPDCAGVPGQRRTKIHTGSSSNGHLLGKLRKSPLGRRSRKFARTTRPPTQMQPQAETARTQQVPSATRMSSCFRSDPECRDVDASATRLGPRPLVIRASQRFATSEPTRRVIMRIMKCDADVHEQMCTFFVLSSDTTMFQDIDERMPTTSAPASMQFKVICPPERNHSM